IGLVVSITTLPARCGASSPTRLSAAAPLTARTTTSPHFAASTNVPIDASPLARFVHASSLAGPREPRLAGRPCLRNPLAGGSPTTPEPRIAIFFIAPTVHRWEATNLVP